ncbi:MAG: ABC transporter permease [Oscillospiraceae bacterium]|nr:ABC transporter permease [Oscillospiraceae bacterium]
MNIFRKYTRRALAVNRTRTLVTIVGIILSMALFTAVIEGAYSGVQFLVRAETERVGAFHAYYYGMTAEEAEKAAGLKEIKNSSRWQEVGWAEIDSSNEYKPYLLIESVDDSFNDLVSVHLIDGRMPDNENEILLPDHLSSNGNLHFKNGDSLTLTVGRRMYDGYELTPANPCNNDGKETIADSADITYTVVGHYERLDNCIEDYSCPGYTSITKGGGKGSSGLFVELKNPYKARNFLENSGIDANVSIHRDLLYLYGAFSNGNLSTLVYRFAAILVILIAFGSVSLIYNSFSISVSERTKQFGILKSVGATKKQIRGSVLYEALVLSGIGIPLGLIVGCAGIGITLYCLRDAFSTIVEMGRNTQMRLVLNPWALLIAVVICLITTLISAWIPAKKAIKISAIDSIRQSEDVKIKPREIKTSRLTQKLFGFEGMMASKNFKRNRKRYRSTVVSLFLSIVLFISASSFCSYLTDAVGGVTSSNTKTDISYYTVGEDQDPEGTFKMLSEVNGVTDSVYMVRGGESVFFDADELSPDYRSSYIPDGSGDAAEVGGSVVFVNDEAFRKLCRENGINAEKYFDKNDPMGLIYNSVTLQEADEKGNIKWVAAEIADENALPCTVYSRVIKEMEGYACLDYYATEGDVRYCPQDYLEEFYSDPENNGKEPDDAHVIRVPYEEAAEITEFKVDRVVDETLFALRPDTMAIIYPRSMLDTVVQGTLLDRMTFETDYFFMVEDHGRAFEEMKNILTENGMDTSRLYDEAEQGESMRMIVKVVNVFAYGFIILISLIAAANVFNTISTNISLRRREFAMLKSIGMGNRGFSRMMNYECLIYGLKGIAWGLPAAILMTYLIYRVTSEAYGSSFYIPWYSVAIAVGSVFAVVFATMLYATRKIKNDNPIDALKNENL